MVNTRFRCLVLSALLTASVGCTTGSLKSNGGSTGSAQFKLEVIPKIGRSEVTQYHSRAVSRIYKENTLHKKSKGDLDFQVKTTIKTVDPMANRIQMAVQSQNKSGEGELHEYAIPEIGEVLELTINEHAEVLKAGDYPSDSIFYLPTIALPKREVEVGDSWEIKVKWVTETQKIPLRMELVSIFKELRKCDGEPCALIELDGEVRLDATKQDDLDLKSQMRGYLYFSLQTGSVIWSHIRSDQEFKVGHILNKFKSCLVSYVIDPEKRAMNKRINPFCEPEEELTSAVIP